MIYKLLNKPTLSSMECILRKNDDESFTIIVCTPDNTDYQAYLKWLSEGNEPLPADQ